MLKAEFNSLAEIFILFFMFWLKPLEVLSIKKRAEARSY